MVALAFDTLTYINRLKSQGVDSKTAEACAVVTCEIVNDLVKNQLVTQDYFKKEIVTLELKLYRFILRIMAASVGLICTVQGAFHFLGT